MRGQSATGLVGDRRAPAAGQPRREAMAAVVSRSQVLEPIPTAIAEACRPSDDRLACRHADAGVVLADDRPRLGATVRRADVRARWMFGGYLGLLLLGPAASLVRRWAGCCWAWRFRFTPRRSWTLSCHGRASISGRRLIYSRLDTGRGFRLRLQSDRLAARTGGDSPTVSIWLRLRLRRETSCW